MTVLTTEAESVKAAFNRYSRRLWNKLRDDIMMSCTANAILHFLILCIFVCTLYVYLAVLFSVWVSGSFQTKTFSCGSD